MCVLLLRMLMGISRKEGGHCGCVCLFLQPTPSMPVPGRLASDAQPNSHRQTLSWPCSPQMQVLLDEMELARKQPGRFFFEEEEEAKREEKRNKIRQIEVRGRGGLPIPRGAWGVYISGRLGGSCATRALY